jgi:3-deoxy-D-arabino-heptulosonate 7-phosphate (DAHP) synthase
MIFPHIVNLISAVETQSALGGLKYTYTTSGTSYAAFVQTRTETRAEVLNTAGSREATVIYIRGSCPAKELDRVEYASKTYEVTGVVPARSMTDTHHTKLLTLQLDQTTR